MVDLEVVLVAAEAIEPAKQRSSNASNCPSGVLNEDSNPEESSSQNSDKPLAVIREIVAWEHGKAIDSATDPLLRSMTEWITTSDAVSRTLTPECRAPGC